MASLWLLVVSLRVSLPSQSVNFMGIDRVGMGLIPACSWRHAQQPPTKGIDICRAVVEESAIE